MPAAENRRPAVRRGPGASKPATRSARSKASASSRRKPASKRTAAAGKLRGRRASVEQLADSMIKPLDLVMLTRRADPGDARRSGRARTGDPRRRQRARRRARSTRAGSRPTTCWRISSGCSARGREQIGSATKRVRGTDSVEILVRAGDRARRTVGVGPTFPILGYDDLTAGQVATRLDGLGPAELRKVRDYERRHANRKIVLAAVERALA